MDQALDKAQEMVWIAQVPPGTLFEHYKGKRYKILAVGRHTETLGMCVIYESLYDCPQFGDHAVWIRPLDMFLETVVIDGKEIPRFRRVAEQ